MKLVDLEGLRFTVTSDASGAAKPIKDLAGALERLKTAVHGLRLKNAADNLSNIGNASQNINTEGLGNLANALGKLGSVKISRTIVTGLNGIVEAAHGLTDNDVSRVERLSEALSGLGSVGKIDIPKISGGTQTPTVQESELSLGTTAVSSEVRSVGDAMSYTLQAAPKFHMTLREIIGDLSSLGKSSSLAGSALRNIAKYTVALPVTMGSQFAGRIKETTASLGHMFAAIKRIAALPTVSKSNTSIVLDVVKSPDDFVPKLTERD